MATTTKKGKSKLSPGREVFHKFRLRILVIARTEIDAPKPAPPSGSSRTSTIVLKKTRLAYRNDAENSDKVYEIILIQDVEGLHVEASHGKRGHTLTAVPISKVPMQRIDLAEKLFASTIQKKLKKGYKVVF